MRRAPTWIVLLLRRELDRVTQQVTYYLLEAFFIGQHDRGLFRLAIADVNILPGDHRAELVDHDLDEGVHARRLQVEHHASRFEFRQIEQIVDEFQEGLGAAADVVEEISQLAAVARFGLFDAELRVAQDPVQRRAKLVRDVRQEFALGAIGRFGRVALSAITFDRASNCDWAISRACVSSRRRSPLP